MAKGDKTKVQNTVNTQGTDSRQRLEDVVAPVTGRTQGLENRFNVSADQGQQDYGSLMGAGQGLMNTTQGLLGTILGGPTQNFGAYGGYQDFANNGGFSDQNIQDMRARSVAPMRAVYQNAQDNINRQRALGGGYSPNYTAASAKMARELGYGLADASTNVEGQLAQQKQQGRLSGLAGMTGIDSALLNSQNQRLGLANSTLGQANNTLGQMGNIYGTAPGSAQLYGGQMLNSSGQNLQGAGLQNDIMRNYLSGQSQVAQTPSNFQSAMGNINSGLNLASNAAKIGGMF
jgi:hypothetical protein